ncbi:hypothetical protein N7474_006178 [Penicillium riverlandense]|uniref:uncharacterized protein n=1 Tax=Penicillium riverlandense TaxID=1903569 RepID=UPI00254908E6|nr:uncharacterized protein N7474_006178 [Penicillium riverlandense]KAJ5820587.1 hypothetical protein N7474_006178 [Penicillium riverlandense]
MRLPKEILCIFARLTPDQVKTWDTDIKVKLDLFADSDDADDANDVDGADDVDDVDGTDDFDNWIGDIDESLEFDYESNIHKRNPNYLPRGRLFGDRDVGPEMKFISQPHGYPIEDVAAFTFLDYAGSDSTVYVHDTGMNLQDPEFQNPIPLITRGAYRWLTPRASRITGLAGQEIAHPQMWTDSMGHGTCMASKIVGERYGVAKAANLTIVPYISGSEADGEDDEDEDEDGIEDSFWISYMMAGLQAIVDDIDDQRKDKNGYFFPVVNLSYTIPKISRKQTRHYRKCLQTLADLDAVIVGVAGNQRHKGKQFVSDTLGNMAPDFPDNMILVGATDVHGVPAAFSQRGRSVQIWAPGTLDRTHGIPCAGGLEGKKGTSLSAAQVSGIVAYLYSSHHELRIPGSGAPKVLEELKTLMYPRFSGGPPCLWNGAKAKVYCS